MDKVNGNYLTQSNKDFPLDCETLDYIAKNIAIVEALGNIGGDKVILSGCEPTNGGSVRSEGYVFLKTNDFPNGEILRWEGGASTRMYLKKEDVSVVADGYDYPKAYTRRTLAPGLGEESYLWSDFSNIQTNVELSAKLATLENQLNGIAGEPLGVVKMWAGPTLPDGYIYCDGTAYPNGTGTNKEYAKLYAVLGDTFNSAPNSNGKVESTSTGYFRVPDLRGRFIVGYNGNDSDYNKNGKCGGEKTHTLTTNEIPSHTHGQNLWAEGNNDWKGGGNASPKNATSKFNATTPYGNTNATGGGLAHENRPPYYVLAYIIKYK
ncbi:MAG: tail fiber protein [Bacteroidaceae bacterium]|nr:tail fiber protein [Bacteroidaceae bacterium]